MRSSLDLPRDGAGQAGPGGAALPRRAGHYPPRELAQTSGSSPWEEATLTEVEHVAQRIVTAIDFLRSHVAAVQTQPAPAVETLATRLLAFLEQVRRPGHAGLTGPLANIRAKFQIEPLKGAIIRDTLSF